MRKGLSFILSAAIAIISCFTVAINTSAQSEKLKGGENGPFYSESAVNNWSSHNVLTDGIPVKLKEALIDGIPVSDDVITLKTDHCLSFNINVPCDGEYNIYFKYSPESNANSVDTLFDFKLYNSTEIVQLPILWSDSKRGETDRSGNETTPEQLIVGEAVYSPLISYSDIAKSYAVYSFKASEITTAYLVPTVQAIKIYEILLCPVIQLQNYSEICGGEAKSMSDDTVIIEAEQYSLKSDSYIRGSSVRNAALYPYDSIKKCINVIDGSTWNSAGQKLLWEFEIPSDGYYKIAMRVRQSDSTNKSVFRKFEIDSKTPYAEWEAVKIPYMGATGYKNITIGDGTEQLVYLEEGYHTIAMTAVMGEYTDIYNSVYDLMSEIDNLGISLMKMTAGSSDVNRTWDMSVYMPDAVDKIADFAERIDALYEQLKKIEGREPTYAGDLTYLSKKLRDMLKNPEKIPNKTEELCSGDSSVSKYLGDLLSVLALHPLTIDRIYIYGNTELPKASVGFFKSFVDSLKRFFWSFLPEAAEQDHKVTGKSDKELQVWVGQSVLVTSIMQQLVDEQYNSKNGTNIKLSVMPSEQKLVLANAAGSSPDVVLCAGAGTPYTFAVRGALKNLFDYDDFLTYYTQEYNLSSLVSTSYNGGVYGVVDSRNFQLLFYRKDILNSLGLDIPKTWDDVEYMMPTLLRNNMNFYISLSSSVALKGLGVTGPFIYQNGGELYSDDGLSVDINSDFAIDAITRMVEFYNIYGMQTNVPSFYNSFRYGKIPVGIGDFNMYLQLKVTAPELAGQWGVALTPGTTDESGNIIRCQPASATSSFIFKSTEKSEEAWNFLKWWLSSDTQLEYSKRRCIDLGMEYQWNTANEKAFALLPMDSEVKNLAFSQWEQQREILPHPAAYIVERELSSVWNSAVVNNKSMIEALDKAVITSNREIKRKLREFGYIDNNDNIVRNYDTAILEMLNKRLKEEQKQ